MSDNDRDVLRALEDFSGDDSTADPDFVPESTSDEDDIVSSTPKVFVNENRPSNTIGDQNVEENGNEGENNEAMEVVCEKKKLRRWKRPDPKNWVRNIAKENKYACLPYKDQKGIERKAKAPQQVNCNHCRFKCTTFFIDDARTSLCSEFWKLQSYERQKDFLLRNVVSVEPKRRRTSSESNSKRKIRRDSKCYYFPKDSDKQRVCKNFFMKTLNISWGPIANAFCNSGEGGSFIGKDRRGKVTPSNKTPVEVVNHVMEHIESFPKMESHYIRKASKCMYLDAKLSISKMHYLFENQCKELKTKSVSLITYRRIFGTNFNYSFFHPKKDQCTICTRYDSATPEEKMSLEDEHASHIQRKNEANECKAMDKEHASNDASFVSATFDLQSVLQIPSNDVSPLYYTRKLNGYNLTI